MKRSGCVVVAALLVGACGTTPADRTVSGAGIGAAGGAVVGALTGLTVLESAAIGAVVGGATGLFTHEDTVNLGKPPWTSSAASVGPAVSTATTARPPMTGDAGVVKRTQEGLARLGYEPGPVDGILGAKTRDAIVAYQKDYGLRVDGHPTPRLAADIRERADKQAELRAAFF